MAEQIMPPVSGDAVRLADWLEVVMFTEHRRTLSKARLRQALANTLFFGEEENEQVEVEIELMLQEIDRRRGIAPAGYPFRVLPMGVEVDSGTDPTAYKFMLMLSASQSLRSELRQAEVEVLFDLLVLEALRRYLGPGTRGLRFGWPPRGTERPKDFRSAISWLASQLGLSVGKGKARPRSKDGGLDVVAWKPFSDGRTGFLVVLAQCTIQIAWWPKAKDIVPSVWCGWIDFGLEPLTALALPFVIPPSFEKWDELRRTVSLVLDRLRLSSLLSEDKLECGEEISEWTDKELSRLARR